MVIEASCCASNPKPESRNPKEILGRLYRERADSENPIDELKRQWGWGGFVTQDLLRCQVAARNVALIYNWWSLLYIAPIRSGPVKR